MSMFGNIVSALFHHAAAAAPAQTLAADAPASAATTSDPAPAGAGAATPPAGGAPTAAGASPPSPGASPAGGAAQTVDARAVLAGLAAKDPQKLNWQNSIVDMMKLLGLDSSLSNRKQLAQELHYTGSTDDSATMNVWLHGEVMKKLSENGGQVPADLKA